MEHIPSGLDTGVTTLSEQFAIIVERLESSSSAAKGNSAAPLAKIRAERANTNELYAGAVERLARLGIPQHIVTAAMERSKSTGATFVHELCTSGHLDLRAYYSLLAADLGIPFESSIDHQRLLPNLTAPLASPGRTALLCCRGKNANLVLYMAPDIRSENQLAGLFAKTPSMRANFRICVPGTIRDAIEASLEQTQVESAINKLHQRWPHLSAKDTLVPWQAFTLGVFVSLFPIFLWVAMWPTLLVLHLIALVLFGIGIAIRFAAWRAMQSTARQLPETKNCKIFPVYSVMIALHNEAAVVPQLVRSMSRLDWPASRLEVLYVCEADDKETITALGRMRLPAPHRVICVPPSLPRTKPKALNYALGTCTGEFVVIYDAEDRPHPHQLKEACLRFQSEPEVLACLQAPLDIANPDQSWLSKMFAFEYAAHFHGLLPYLNRIGAPLPLGGTSNHFRRSALIDVLGWDPFNVTEDADLGIRLYRSGYRCGTIFSPTLEDAPTDFNQWLPQRTRWIKGWMQTFLVHNRSFRDLDININKINSIIFEILMVCFILSPLLYSISIIQLIYFISTFNIVDITSSILVCIDVSIMALGHLFYSLLAASCWKRVSNKPVIAIVAYLPMYWLLASMAAWRAVWKLLTAPHQWEKTTHHAAYRQNQSPEKSHAL